MYRRAMLIYLGAIVAPAAALLWLGIESFERQRHALAALAAEKLAAVTDARVREAARSVLAGGKHPIAKYDFLIEGGRVVLPAMHSPPPVPSPSEFADAEREEFERNNPEAALTLYRRVSATHPRKGLALSRVARCLSKLGRDAEARAVWRDIAVRFPEERDLAGRTFGIVAAIQAGQTAGLLETIQSGHWNIPVDQAEYFASQLGGHAGPRNAFARELSDRFRNVGGLREGELYTHSFGSHRVFYTAEGGERIRGFSVDEDWVAGTLRPEVERELAIDAPRAVVLYGGAVALVVTILGAGVFLLLRDVSRETRTNRVRSDLVSSVSHELKTPITLIRLYAETLLGRGDFGEEDRRGFYRIIMRESDRLTRLVESVLTFSRIERGERVYNFEQGDAVPVIARTLDDYRSYIERAGFRLERSIPDSGPLVRFDATAISQAVLNLLDNAVKYSGESRDVAVRVRATPDSLVIEVEDRGIGIAEADRVRVFERFYRVSNGSGKGGYGIGLFLVRHIMEAHGGRAEVESEPGAGTRFRLLLPAVNG